MMQRDLEEWEKIRQMIFHLEILQSPELTSTNALRDIQITGSMDTHCGNLGSILAYT